MGKKSKLSKIKKKLTIKREYKNILVVIIPAVMILFALYTWQEKRHVRRLASVISEMTAIKDGLDWDQMGDQEKKSKYRQMMIKVLSVYGFQKDDEFQMSMNTDQKINYINFNFEVATKLSFGLFDVPIIHQMETSFNPYALGQFSEVGIGQIKYSTALFAEKLLKLMPKNIQKILEFELKNREDLFDPIISTKISYVLLWFYRREFEGREDWYISTYHWGGFLSRRWNKGESDVPVKFILNDVEYNVIKYYVAFKGFQSAYESGQIEVGKAIEEKWRKYQKRLVKEEIDFRTAHRTIKKLRKLLNEKRKIENDLVKKEEEIVIALNTANQKLKEIARGSQKDGKVSLRKVKNVVKKLLEVIDSK